MEYGCVDDIWTEVEEKNKDKEGSGSSDMEDNISVGSHADFVSEQISSYRVNSLPGRPKVLEDHQLTEIIDQVNKQLQEDPTNPEATNKDADNPCNDLETPKELDQLPLNPERPTENPEPPTDKQICIEKDKFNELVDELEKIHKEVENGVPDTADDEIEEIDYKKLRKLDDEERKANELPELIVDQDSDSEADNERELFKSCRAISDIANNTSVDPTPDEIVRESINSMYNHFGSEIFKEHTESIDQLLGPETSSYELDPKVCCVIPRKSEEGELEDQQEFVETNDPQYYDEESAEINDKVEYDMEEISSHLDEDLQELQEPLKKIREELDPLVIEADDEKEERAKCIDMTSVAHSIRLTEQFSMLRERISEGERLIKEENDKKASLIEEIVSEDQIEIKTDDAKEPEERILEGDSLTKQQEDKKADLIEEIVSKEQIETDDAIDPEDYAFAKALDLSTDDVPTRVYGNGCDEPSYKWVKEECLRQLSVKKVDTKITDDIYEGQPLSSKTSAEEADEICKQMNDKLAQDEASLRKLLQDLEDKADLMYDIESAVEEKQLANEEKEPASADITENLEQSDQKEDADADAVKKYEDLVENHLGKEMEPDVSEVCTSLLHELVDELQYREITSGHDIKCYDFGTIESDDEYSYSTAPNVESIVPAELENPAGGKSIRECVEAFGDFIVSVKERQRKKPAEKKQSTCSEKVRAAQELLKSKTPFDFSSAQLDAEMLKQEEKTKRRIAAMAARCYEKRESYEDSLEVVDNRLMIVKKGTGALEELPPPPPLISDSESELESNGRTSDAESYDTAEETHEAVMDALSRPYTSRGLWAKPGQPQEIVQPPTNGTPFVEQMEKPSLLDQALDQFYSAQSETAFNSIDTEFLDKLDLQKVIGTDGEITDEGMRTYNELQAQHKSESTQNEQSLVLLKEDEMLKGLIEGKRMQEERERQVNELDNLQDLTKFKINFELTKQEIPKRFDKKPESIEDVIQSNYIEYTEQNKEETPTELSELQLEPKEGEFELRELPNPNEIGSIKLTRGSCKLYEIKSQLPEMLEDIEEEKVAEEKTEETIEKIMEGTDTNEKEENNPNEGSEKSTAVTRNFNASIDDDILSDASTDYESSEEIPMVEPPKLPLGARNNFFCNEFEDGLKYDLECEEALRRELFSLNTGSWILGTEEDAENKIEITEEKSNDEENDESEATGTTKDLNQKSTVEDDQSDSEMEGAVGKLPVSAKEQWAKISKKLHDFINTDDMKLLNEREFNDDNSDNDDQLLVQDIESFRDLESIDEEPDGQTENDYIGKMEDNPNCNRNEIAEKPNVNNIDTQDAPDVPEQTSCSKNAKPPPAITLDYFDADEPNDDVDFGKSGELKTEEIECNLEILNDDDDAVVKEVSVNAQVTYEFN